MTIEDVYRRYPTREEQEQFLLELLEQEERERVSPALEVFRPKSLGGNRPEHKVIMGCRGGRGAGAKCLQVGTLVWMYDGSRRRVEDVRVGDQVMGPDSRPRLVLSTTRGVGQLYKVKQAHAMDYVVNDEHILTLKKASHCYLDKGPLLKHGYRRPNGAYPSWPDMVDISIRDYMGMSARWKENFNGIKAGTIKYRKRKLPIDPYVFGAWLGDGNSLDAGITTADPETLEPFKKLCLSMGLVERVYQKRGKYNLAKTYVYTTGTGKGTALYNPFIQILKKLKVHGNKHIPDIYLVNDEDSRLQLLAGLIDTDGTLRNNLSGYTFCQSDETLSRQVKQLADSLGFRTSIIRSDIKCNGRLCEAYKVNISGDIWRIPCRIPRKQISEKDYTRKSNWRVSYIKLEDHGIGEYAGFTLNGDHRFLLDDGTITHNSWSLTSLIVQRAHYEEKPLRIMCLREIQRSLEESVYELVSKTVDRLGFKGWHKTKEYIQAPNGSRFLFRGLKDIMAANQVKGLEGFNIFFIEEAATISKESWDTLMPTLMRTPGAELWFAYNRENEVDPIDEKIWNRNRPDALLVELRPGRLDNPWWDFGGLQAEMDADFEFDPDEAEHIWYGQPRKQGQRSVLGRAAIRQAMSRVISDPEGQIQIGCDVARFGDDRTVAYMRKGMKTIAERVWSKQDTQTTAKALLDFADYDPSVLYAIDDTGVGGGVTDRLREEGRKVLAVNFGANARDRDRYVDVASEMWFDFPLDDAEIPDDPELMSELSGRQYDFDKKGRRKLESKADYKKRLNRSPDKADALVLTYYSGGGQIFDDEMRTDMLAYRKMRGR